MKAPLRIALVVSLVIMGLLAVGVSGPTQADTPVVKSKVADEKPAKLAAEAGVVIQERGPIHEGFAKPTPTDSSPSEVVSKEPPKPIPELPPDQKPEGKNVQWLPGYWSWDANKRDYVWVSGSWRVPPADRQWVPGHWAQSKDGWQWVPGFWSGQRPLDYLRRPPDSLDRGPSGPPPDENSFYVPGVWLPLRDRFIWRPGYWSSYRTGAVWINSSYIWTPGGYVFVDGYWDYPFEDRGLLFAPVCFDYFPYWYNPFWCYRPRFALGFGTLCASFWIGPGHHCYYFGNYYGHGFARQGFTPWLTYGPRFHDPAFGYYSWANRANPAWMSGLRSTYLARSTGVTTRSLGTVAPLGRANPSVKLSGVTSADMAAQRTNIKSLQSQSLSRARVESAPQVASLGGGRAVTPTIINGGASQIRFYSGPAATGGVRVIQGTSAATGGVRVIQGTSSGSTRTASPAAYRSAPSYRYAPSYRGGGSYHGGGGGGSRGGGGGGGRGGGGHR
jgi:hypothetical protein